jgi:hypothetical protein
MVASVESNTALETSAASALVGIGELTMDSNIWVATITGFANFSSTLAAGNTTLTGFA